MNTKLNLTYKGVQYCLEYDRNTVKVLESQGLDVVNFMNKPLTNVELAFHGAFIKNHRNTKETVIDEIYRKCKNKNDLITTLGTMIAETYESLTDEEEDTEGNVEWEVVDLKPKGVQK